ncbi:cupin domain-containing protein [Spirosoma validum]|uniref:Cupin domain-containing protein n=1 Tax=Spirosoma validum TaxID=2771355 RepID=A0A927B4K4_9BACT|nr:cupin domain-containing protein [Spirosoma validum]MBD2755279.1 cupin domain-containing protein [Spirosoma validum]
MKRTEFLTGVIGGFSLLHMPAFGSTYADPAMPFYIPPKPALTPGPGNSDIRTIIHAKQTGNQFSNVEVAMAPNQMGPSPHVHKELDELMYVLEGTATVLIGKEIYEVQAGGWNFRPHGIIHAIWNASDKPLRFIDNFFHQNFEDYLEELIHQIVPDMIRRKLTPSSPEIASRVAALDKKFGVTWYHDQRQAIVDKYKLQG